MQTQENTVPRRHRAFTLERVLLSAVLGMQLVIAWGVYRHAPLVYDRGGEVGMDRGVAEAPASAAPSRAPVSPAVPGYPPRGLLGEMDAALVSALDNMVRLRSAIHIDEGWEAILASPTMDMRDGDRDYLVSFSIPGAQTSDIQVSLDGRVLTVQALSPVQGPHFVHMQRFERRVLLPGPIGGAEDASANITNGVLTVRVPKGDGDTARRGVLRLF